MSILAINLQGDSLTIVVLGAVLALLQIYAIVRPNPALHKQFADKDSTDGQLKEIKTLLVKKMEDDKEDRRLIYNRLNKHGQALSYIAGRLERKRDSDGPEIRKILTASEETYE